MEFVNNKVFVFYLYNKYYSMKSKKPKNYILKLLNKKVTKKTIFLKLLTLMIYSSINYLYNQNKNFSFTGSKNMFRI